jgi:hypothetical protein
MLKKITMLSSREGSPDGRRVQWYLEGKTYETTEYLALIFLKEGWAEDAELPKIETPKAEVATEHKREYARRKGR